MAHLSFFFLFPLGGYELIAIIFAIVLLFGGRKIPELMRGLGKGIREFNSARASIEEEIKEGMKEEDGKKKSIQSSTSKEKTEE
ncbi:MAG: twin-arginine translocase TatA/TatE family subunit [Saprospirales bacterium]|jgi:sec-independent protein translocase protein TatA|nr:MAG: twin-arginine translocase TatA/TatE family subunit [Saprospirales bacterium]